MLKKINRKHIIMAALALVIGIALYVCSYCGVFTNCTAQGMKDYIKSFGIFAPLIYIIMFTIVPLTLFPDAALAIAGGMIFGVRLGTLYTIIGAACGGILSFYISRLFGRSLVEKLVKGKGQWFDDGVEKRGFLLIFILRLIPLIPFDVISYGAGLSKIGFRDFLMATVLGIIPGVWVYTNLGDKAGNIFSLEFLGAVAVLLLLMMVSFIIKKKLDLKKLENKIVENQLT